MKNQEEIDYLQIEQNYRQWLSDKYVAYMTYATTEELMLLAALVDVRYNNTPKRYSIYTIEEALPKIKELIS